MSYKVRLELYKNIRIKIITNSSEYIKYMKKKFTHHVKNYFFIPKFKSGQWDGKTCLISSTNTFPYGLLPDYLKYHKKFDKNIELTVSEEVRKLFKGDEIDVNFDLSLDPRPYQKESIEYCLKFTKGIIRSATACHAKGDKIILSTGEVRNIEDIKIGDYVIGKDGYPKKVLNIFTGLDDLYKIIPKNKRTPITVTKSHILHLVFTNRGGKYDKRKVTFENISVENYLNKTKYYKHISKLSYFDKNIYFNYKKINCSLSPYFIGLYLGDGHSNSCAITNPDKECIDVIYKEAKKFNMEVRTKLYKKYSYFICGSENKRNKIFKEFDKIGLKFGYSKNPLLDEKRIQCEDKHIPIIIFSQDILYRKEVLAGLIDSDGSLSQNKTYYEFTSKSKKLRDDTELLAISLGLVCSKPKDKKVNGVRYYRLNIMGNISKIPIRIKRKKDIKSTITNSYRSGFDIEYIGKGEFYGIQVEGSLYLTNNGMITHNSGKSLVISYIVKALLDNREKTKVRRALIIVPSKQLVEQFYTDMQEYGIKGEYIGRIYDKIKNKPVQWAKTIVITTWQSLKNNMKRLNDYYAIIGDECVDPNTEILTSSGWKLIKDLKEHEKVAQWNEEENISFVKPIKYIEKDFDGEMIHWKGKQTDILTTPNHQQPYKTKYKSGNQFNRKYEIKDIKFGYNKWIPISGHNNGNGNLTPLMRFKIMAQADGHIYPKRQSKDYTIVNFKFRKNRKIKRFLDIIKSTKFEWKELTSEFIYSGKVRRFNVKAPKNIRKSLWDLITLDKINPKFTNEFINELVQWDGSIKDGKLYYSTTSSSNADAIQAICTLGGWSCSRTVQHDNRSPKYNSIHRIWFYEKRWRNTQRFKKTIIPYRGKVYCVRVPDGNIIIRRNNKVSITGNCHQVKAHELKKIFSKSPAKYRLGFTGTMPNDELEILQTKSFLGPVLRDYPSGLLGEQGYIAKCNVNILNIDYPLGIEADYYPDVKRKTFENKFRMKLIKDIVNNLDHNVLLLVGYKREGRQLLNYLGNYTKRKTIFLSGDDDVDFREKWRKKMITEKNMALVATYGIFQQGINIPNLKYLILAAPFKSKIRVLQSIGRALRAHEDKTDGAFIFDIVDNVKYLRRHGDERYAFYESEGFNIKEVNLNDKESYDLPLLLS